MRSTEFIVKKTLSEAQFEAFRACRAPGSMSVREFARETDRAPGTVGNHLRRAARNLHENAGGFYVVARRCDFEQERDDETASFQRARDEVARIRKVAGGVFTVAVGDGERHVCALFEGPAGYRGACDCPGWQYHNGPCAHLCALRMADFVHERGVRGERIRAEPGPDPSGGGGDRARADGGRRVEHETIDDLPTRCSGR